MEEEEGGKKAPLIKRPRFFFFWKRYSVTISGTMQSLEVADVAALIPSRLLVLLLLLFAAEWTDTFFVIPLKKEKKNPDTPQG